MKKAREFIIALDQGSSSSRALAFDLKGRLAAGAQFPVKTFYPKPGWIEHDPLDLARTQEKALDRVVARLPRAAKILGAGIASQRSTVVFWDRKTGKPACRAPSWQDGRASSITSFFRDKQEMAHEKTGLYLTPYYSAAKIRWFLDNEPGARRLLEEGRLMAAPVSTFLIWRLTRGEVFACDASMAQRMMLFNIRTGDWDDELLDLFRIPRSILPSIFSSCGDWGSCQRLGRSLPLLASLGDQQAAAVGLGGMEAGSSVANYGTGAFFLHNTGRQQHRVPGLLTSVGWKLKDEPAVFLQEGTVHAAGSCFDWMRSGLGLLGANGAAVDKSCRASTHRLLALPALGGLGAPRWDYAAKAAFYGLTARTRPADLVRAMAEGIAFLMSDIVSAMRAGGLSPSEAKVSGGLSRSAYLMQFQADLLGMPLRRCAQAEATALGAACLAARAAGAEAQALLGGRAGEKVFFPLMREPEREKLLRAWSLFVDAQRALGTQLEM